MINRSGKSIVKSKFSNYWFLYDLNGYLKYMTTTEIPLLPKNLGAPQMKILAYVLKNEKAAKIISVLCDKKGSYFNEIHEKVLGSKTSTQEILRSLERLKIISSEWQIRHIDKGGRKVTRAIKLFTLTKDKEILLEEYLPLIKKMIDF